jgi:predicted acylesterase/phospholipase RssA
MLLCCVFAGCCGREAMNVPLTPGETPAGYRFEEFEGGKNSDELFVILTFSGGGTRAAALSYGVLQTLRDTEITIGTCRARLLDEVDVISSVSGGSFTAAYYGLFRDRFFEDFEPAFLKKDVESDLLGDLLSLRFVFQLMSDTFSRIDVAAMSYDRSIYQQKTFADLAAAGRRPYVIINASDLTQGQSFEFTQDYFDWLGSDLSQLSVARAVAASSAFPVLLNPLTLKNYAKADDFLVPAWVLQSRLSREIYPDRYSKARQLYSYLDVTSHPYVHLVDGGVADNLGVRTVQRALTDAASSWSLVPRLRDGRIKHLAVIVVNARRDPEVRWDRSPIPPGDLEVAEGTINRMQDNFTFDSVIHLRETLKELKSEKLRSYMIEVSFDDLVDAEERKYFKELPTRFKLDDKDVDQLKWVAGRLLKMNPGFRALVENLNTNDPGTIE